MKKRFLFFTVLFFALAFLVAGCSGTQKQSAGDTKPPAAEEKKQPAAEKKEPAKSPEELAAEFYKDKTINFIISFPTGGGYDSECRLLGPYLEKYTGAKVVMENVDGGSGLTGTNKIWKAKADGLTFGVTGGGGIATWPLVEDPGMQFDAKKLTYFGALFGEERILSVRNGTGIKTVKDLMSYDKELKQAFKAKGGANYVTSVLMWNMFPTKKPIKGIFGYRKSSEQTLALERGEVDLHLGSGPAVIDMVKEGKITSLVAISEHPPEGLPADVPNLWKEKDQSVVPAANQPYMKAAIGIVKAGRPIVGPPGIPDERVKYIESILKKIANDSDFKEKAAKMGSMVSGANGADTKAAVMDVLNSPPDVVKMIKESNSEN